MFLSKTIRLFWWNEKIIQKKNRENYGDLLGKYLVEKISSKKVIFAWPKKFSVLDYVKPIYVTVGSIMANINQKCIVWGSGIIDRNTTIKNAVFLAVRGPQTRKFLLDLSYEVPEIYGDPALLLPRYFNPKVEKKYKFGFIPHYSDFSLVQNWFEDNPEILLIDMMTNNVEAKTIEFLECEKIVSSSLHGLIVAHAYNIPAVWQKFSDKVFGDGIKYQDYFESVQLPFVKPEIRLEKYSNAELEKLFQELPNLPKREIIEKLCDGLMEVCPFKN
ncbi:polysaccharide pyruvyl transferase family protein [Flavobacterium crocinum]|uniref:Polysaccharide pyruvyl transferase family protein n=1 Tax=Flavobacterium crocinum TaxID=2183896 RepID=A0A2S1YG04_9FLAO|nr:polysaccharide pyruvyl transferase family protein [Flavobacterium crocinum]AWK02979.1 polysaccharide pyruvyl transferase family protein [Flavobacterium crocinum]